MNSKEKSFFSKVLLFGEYSVIKNSMALSVPYNLFEGKLTFSKKSRAIDAELKAFSHYMKDLYEKGEVDFDFDCNSFEFDISQGLFFESTIPQGFGVGSSGALCAALYDRYCSNPTQEIVKLKKIFSLMESHFHGSSSGVDPLISYMSQPILMRSKEELGIVDIPSYETGKGGLFLLNTGRARRTEPLVNLFLEKCNSDQFNKLSEEELIPITNNCIVSFLERDIDSLAQSFNELSHFQFTHFNQMIPKLFRDVWQKGLELDDYKLKLCGAGGGGFLLGMTRDFSLASRHLDRYEIRPLLRF